MHVALARPARLLLASLTLVGLAACGGGSTQPATPQPTATVNATNSLQFSPATVRLTVGGTVTFKFASIAHTLFFDNAPPGAPANVPNLTSNTSVTRTFGTAGTFVYNCHIHPGMSGTIIVE